MSSIMHCEPDTFTETFILINLWQFYYLYLMNSDEFT